MSASHAAEIRRRYLAEAVETSTPAVRLTMLFDRLDHDLRAADAAFAAGSIKEISDTLIHAQEIVLALRDTLRLDVWEGAPRLAALYDFFHSELVSANLAKDRDRAARTAELIGQIGEAFREAAQRSQQEAFSGVA